MAQRLKRTLLRLLQLRPGEARRVLPLALAYGLILTSLYVLKPARNSLFLSSMGAESLPAVLIAAAVLGSIAAVLFARATAARRLETILRWTFPAFGFSLVAFWWGLSGTSPLGVFLFYVWVNLYGNLATALIWLFANVVFDAREARRVFGLIGAVGIAGAVAGGAFTREAVALLGTHHLLLVAAGLVAIAFAFLAPVQAPRDVERRPRRAANPNAGVLDDLTHNPLLRVLGMMALCTALVSAVVDIQFNRVVNESFGSEDERTAFFGAFFAVLNGGAFLIQLLLTSRLLGRAGLGATLMLLPALLAVGSTAVFLLPGLLTVTLLKASDVGVRHSLNKSALEILFLPIRSAVKQRARVFLDATVDNIGTGLGALLVLFATSMLGFGTSALSVISGFAIFVWVALALRARVAYLGAFRQALDRRELDPADVRIRMSEASQVVSLLPALQSDNPRQVEYALDMLHAVTDTSLVTPLLDAVRRGAPDVRAKALALLAEQRSLGELRSRALALEVRAYVDDPELDVRVEALHASIVLEKSVAETVLGAALEAPGAARVSALGCIARYFPSLAGTLLDEPLCREVSSLEGEDALLARAALARAFGASAVPRLRDRLARLRDDPEPAVVAAVIEAAGRGREPSLLHWLIEMLAVRRHRNDAIDALAQFGAEAVQPLARAFDAAEDPVLRRAMVRALRGIGTQSAVDVLLARAHHRGAFARLYVLKTLNKLRLRSPGLTFKPMLVNKIIESEFDWQVSLLRTRAGLTLADDASRLLRRVLGERRAESLARTFRLLALLYPPVDIYNAYLGIESPNHRVRAQALEFLENVLKSGVRHKVIALAEPVSDAERQTQVARRFGRPDWVEPLDVRHLLDGGDDWVRACAVFSIHLPARPELQAAVQSLTRDSDAFVREAAGFVLARDGSATAVPAEERPPC